MMIQHTPPPPTTTTTAADTAASSTLSHKRHKLSEPRRHVPTTTAWRAAAAITLALAVTLAAPATASSSGSCACSSSADVVVCYAGSTGNVTVGGVTTTIGSADVSTHDKGVLVETLKPGEISCGEGLVLPFFLAENSWSSTTRTIIYLIAMLWCFLGIAIIADLFMAAIEVITSKRRTTTFVDPRTNQPRTVELLVWNETVANLTLMALGSSAPEILLAVIETVRQLGKPPSADGLGPSTIVGSAAFNLLVILAICVIAIPNGERRSIKEFGVFTVTAISSIFAYVWLLFVLSWNTEDVVDLWEAIVTLIFFPILVVASYYQDRGWCKSRTGHGKPKVSPQAWVTGTGGMGAGGYGGELRVTSHSALDDDMRASHLGGRNGDSSSTRYDPGHGPTAVGRRSSTAGLLHQPQRMSTAMYRINGIRRFTGNAPVYVPKRKLHEMEADIRSKAQRELEEQHRREGGRKADADGEGAGEGKEGEEGEATSIVTFSCATCGVQENDQNVVLLVRRSGTLDTQVSVAFETHNGTAVAGKDYEYTAGNLHFNVGQRLASITIPIIDDQETEPDENFFCSLRQVSARDKPEGAGVVKIFPIHTAEITIIDDDTEGVFDFDTPNITVSENVGDVLLTVRRQHGSHGTVRLKYDSVDGSAVGGKDFVPLDGVLEFAPGELRKTLTLTVLDDQAYEKDEDMKIKLSILGAAESNATIGDNGTITVTITNDADFKRLVDKVALLVNFNLDKLAVRTESWAVQYKRAMTCYAEDPEGTPTAFDFIMHFLAFFWKVLFAAVPPTGMCGGWLAFFVALAFIGGLTAIVGDIASTFGCSLGLTDGITAITFVALGTSLPDTFASKSAAVNNDSADAAVGNVTGSNSVNVFLGLGLPWTIAAIYHAANGTTFVVPSGALSFSVLVFCFCAVVCLGVMALRRLKVFGGSELGGNTAGKYASGSLFVLLWIVYIILSSLKSIGTL